MKTIFILLCYLKYIVTLITQAGIAQLGERQTEDLKVACSIHAHRIFCISMFYFVPTKPLWLTVKPIKGPIYIYFIKQTSHAWSKLIKSMFFETNA